MEQKNVKTIIDEELSMLKVNEQMKKNIRGAVFIKKQRKVLKTVAACCAALLLGSTTVAAGYYFVNKISVNDEVLPELDEMHVVNAKKVQISEDENGMIDQDFKEYDVLQSQLGIDLLDSELAENNPYIQGHLMTDNRDFAMITMENYIIGDTSEFQYLPEENRYQYEHGEKYDSPVSLEIDIILSEEQLKNGWDSDYLGMYESMESFESEQGYQVNVIQDTVGKEMENANTVSEKVAIFVSDGVRYTLKGRVSLDTMKEIINTME